MAEPPYGVIRNKLKDGKVIPFLGAGASIVGRIPGVQWDPNNPQFLPSGRELSHFLAEESSFPSQEDLDRNDLAKVSSYYSVIAGREDLSQRLRNLLKPEFSFGPIHEYLASIAAPLLIITTNYDTLLEQAFQSAGKEYDLIIYPSDPKKENANTIWWWPHGAAEPKDVEPNRIDPKLLEQKTVIYKMHGTIKHDAPDWNSFVITEEDYVNFLSRMTSSAAIPAIVYQHARTRSFLFLGYGLGDWNLRVILKELDNYLKHERRDEKNLQVPSWAIQRSPSELETELWQRRNVNIFDVGLDDFAAKMRQGK
jgi:hypothetical protein